MEKKKTYYLKMGTAKVEVKLEEISGIINASSLDSAVKERIERHDVAECILKTNRAIAFDLVHEFSGTSRFVIVDNYEIAGGGIIQKALEDKQRRIREKVMLRNYKWESTTIPPGKRAEKYNQKPTLILITGQKDTGKKRLARTLEQKLFNDGRFVYFLGIGNVLYGVDADIKGRNDNREEHLRRLAEVSHILLDAGAILIVTAIDLGQDDLEIIKTTVNPDRIETVWLGADVTTDIAYDLHIPFLESEEKAADTVKEMLQSRGLIFRPW